MYVYVYMCTSIHRCIHTSSSNNKSKTLAATAAMTTCNYSSWLGCTSSSSFPIPTSSSMSKHLQAVPESRLARTPSNK